jgi:hypothetical protein
MAIQKYVSKKLRTWIQVANLHDLSDILGFEFVRQQNNSKELVYKYDIKAVDCKLHVFIAINKFGSLW